jgi:hypothetical protein
VARCHKQGTKLVRKFCTGDREERFRSLEAEESPLLEAVAKEMLEKI